MCGLCQVLDKIVYFIGGAENQNAINTVTTYDLLADTFGSVVGLIHERSSPSCCSLNE